MYSPNIYWKSRGEDALPPTILIQTVKNPQIFKEIYESPTVFKTLLSYWRFWQK